MKEFRSSKALHDWCSKIRADGSSIGFVPTMGALHEGHLSLIRQSSGSCDITVCSIFVNPTQFNDPADYEKYPVTIEDDLRMLKETGCCDAVLIPRVEDIYPDGLEYDLDVELGYLGECMEALHRPGHFEGVMQVVRRLLEIAIPDILFLGRKDHQQFLVISRMIEHCGLEVKPVECEIVREEDGLAMSSRNRRLSPELRQTAVLLHLALDEIVRLGSREDPHHLTITYTHRLNEHPDINVEYLEIVDSESLLPVSDWNLCKSAMVCIAAQVGDIRLIDNSTIY